MDLKKFSICFIDDIDNIWYVYVIIITLLPFWQFSHVIYHCRKESHATVSKCHWEERKRYHFLTGNCIIRVPLANGFSKSLNFLRSITFPGSFLVILLYFSLLYSNPSLISRFIHFSFRFRGITVKKKSQLSMRDFINSLVILLKYGQFKTNKLTVNE